jgi:predicted RNA-binding protein with PUA-like domain
VTKTGRYWLFKSEPEVFSISDLEHAPGKTTSWDGVRNYQARNYLRDEVAVGDQVLFYHSNADPPSIAGVAEVVKAGYPDPSAFNKKSKYFDEKSDPSSPTWYVVDIKHVKTFGKAIGLSELRDNPKLKNMVLLQKGSRLSIQPVKADEWQSILNMTQSFVRK